MKSPSGRQTVLIVEDEPLLRLNAVDMVEDAGFAALEAADADAAIQILEDRSDICCVFTDIDMPGSMNGLGLAGTIRRRWPPIHILVTSGKVVAQDLDLPYDSLFVSKPYRAPQVAALLHQMTV